MPHQIPHCPGRPSVPCLMPERTVEIPGVLRQFKRHDELLGKGVHASRAEPNTPPKLAPAQFHESRPNRYSSRHPGCVIKGAAPQSNGRLVGAIVAKMAATSTLAVIGVRQRHGQSRNYAARENTHAYVSGHPPESVACAADLLLHRLVKPTNPRPSTEEPAAASRNVKPSVLQERRE